MHCDSISYHNATKSLNGMFNTAFQEPGESVDSFVTRLRKLAVTCNFKTTDDNLSYEDNRDRLILGTSDLENQARTFRECELDLGKIICMLKTNEVASQQLRTISDQVLKELLLLLRGKCLTVRTH